MSDPLQLHRDVDRYLEELYAPSDKALTAALADSEAAGLPPIAVSPTEGKLLYLLAKIAGAKRILEIGLLGGYSAIWLARALPQDGRMISLELEQKHADCARKNLDRAGVGPQVEIRVGPALDGLKQLVREQAAPFDVVFIDADKGNYPQYLEQCLKLVKAGSVILGDNVIRGGEVLEARPRSADARAICEFNRMLAENPRLESLAIPLVREGLDGLAVARVRK